MDEVLDQVAIAFEEDGVNHSVLDELKKVGLRCCFIFRSFGFLMLAPCIALDTEFSDAFLIVKGC